MWLWSWWCGVECWACGRMSFLVAHTAGVWFIHKFHFAHLKVSGNGVRESFRAAGTAGRPWTPGDTWQGLFLWHATLHPGKQPLGGSRGLCG